MNKQMSEQQNTETVTSAVEKSKAVKENKKSEGKVLTNKVPEQVNHWQ